jgi:hypothetical protein
LIAFAVAAQLAVALPANCDDRALAELEVPLARVKAPPAIAQAASFGDRARYCALLRDGFSWRKLPTVLFTAYHTPTVPASMTATAIYRFPLYRRPPARRWRR